MEDYVKIGEALRLVERYEDYLFRRAMGISFIVNGLVFPTIVLLALNAGRLSDFFNINPDVFIPLASGTVLLGGISVIIYVFTSAHVMSSRLRHRSLWSNASHMIIMFSLWFLSFFVTGYAPPPYEVVSWLWAGSFASLFTYAFNRFTSKDWNYPELLIVGAILLLSSIPVLGMGNTETANIVAVAVLAVSFFTAGLYSFNAAQRILKDSGK